MLSAGEIKNINKINTSKALKKKFSKRLFCDALKTHLCAYRVGFFFIFFFTFPLWSHFVVFSSFLRSGALLLPISRRLFYYSFSKRLLPNLREQPSVAAAPPAPPAPLWKPSEARSERAWRRRVVYVAVACCLCWEWSDVWSVMGGQHESAAGACFFFFSSLSVKHVCYAQGKRGLIICRAAQWCRDLWPRRNNTAWRQTEPKPSESHGTV